MNKHLEEYKKIKEKIDKINEYQDEVGFESQDKIKQDNLNLGDEIKETLSNPYTF